jgi:hypothetical protein
VLEQQQQQQQQFEQLQQQWQQLHYQLTSNQANKKGDCFKTKYSTH